MFTVHKVGLSLIWLGRMCNSSMLLFSVYSVQMASLLFQTSSFFSWSGSGVNVTSFPDPCPNIFHCQLRNWQYKSSQENQIQKDKIRKAQNYGIINAVEFLIDYFRSAINLAHYSTLNHPEEVMIEALNQLWTPLECHTQIRFDAILRDLHCTSQDHCILFTNERWK